MSEIIKVGMADLKTCVSPDGVTTLGLGSCVGIAIRDPVTKIGGLAHIMLPDSTTIRNSSQNIAKFADTGIDELVTSFFGSDDNTSDQTQSSESSESQPNGNEQGQSSYNFFWPFSQQMP